MTMVLVGRDQASRLSGPGCSYLEGSGMEFLAGGLFLCPASRLSAHSDIVTFIDAKAQGSEGTFPADQGFFSAEMSGPGGSRGGGEAWLTERKGSTVAPGRKVPSWHGADQTNMSDWKTEPCPGPRRLAGMCIRPGAAAERGPRCRGIPVVVNTYVIFRTVRLWSQRGRVVQSHSGAPGGPATFKGKVETTPITCLWLPRLPPASAPGGLAVLPSSS